MLGTDCFKSKSLVIVLEAVVDKAPVYRFEQAVLCDANVEQWAF